MKVNVTMIIGDLYAVTVKSDIIAWVLIHVLCAPLPF